jgi:Gram-negative bacterial TonB protein C-terminal
LLEAGSASRPVEAAAPPVVAAADMGSVITTLLGAPPSEATARRETKSREEISDGEAVVSEKSFEPLPGNRVTMPWRLVAAIVALAFLSGIASQKGLLSEWFGKGRQTVAAAGAVDASRGNSHPSARPVKAKTAGGPSGAMSSPAAGAAEATKTPASGSASSDVAEPTNSRDSATSTASLREVAARELAALMPKRSNAATGKADHTATNSPEVDARSVPAPDVAEDVYEAPSLVKSVNAVAPPDAVRGFVTGDVKFDALIDAKGKVASAEVISGPTALRSAALEALHGYLYKPATKNGQSVPGHVSVTVKFWYEP